MRNQTSTIGRILYTTRQMVPRYRLPIWWWLDYRLTDHSNIELDSHALWRVLQRKKPC
jgi:hypothetical protein